MPRSQGEFEPEEALEREMEGRPLLGGEQIWLKNFHDRRRKEKENSE